MTAKQKDERTAGLWVGGLAVALLHIASFGSNIEYGSASGWIVAISLLGLDVSALFLIDVAARSTLRWGARLFAGFCATILLGVAVWTFVAAQSSSSMEKTIRDNTFAVATLRAQLSAASSAKDDMLAASKAKPRLQSLYEKKAVPWAEKENALTQQIIELNAATPSKRNVVYTKLAQLFPGYDVAQLEFVVMLALSILSVLSGGISWGYLQAIRATKSATTGATKSATTPRGTKPGGGSKKTPKKRNSTTKKAQPKPPKNVTPIRQIKANILRALKTGEPIGLRASSRSVMHFYRVADKTARTLLKEMEAEGDIKFVKSSNKYVLADKHKRAVA